MKFVFTGTMDELKEAIARAAKESHKDIVVYNTDPNILEIGFCRLGYNAGRFFVANITEENGTVTLDGEIKNIDHSNFESRSSDFLGLLFWYVVGYMILAIPPMILWLFLRRFVSIWIPLLLPFAYMAIRPLLNKRENEKLDKSFVDFMASFSNIV